MFSGPADYAIDLPSSRKEVSPVVFSRLLGFEVRALRKISSCAAREMAWNGSIGLPAYGYLFVEKRPDTESGRPLNVVVGAAFFERDMDDSVAAEWFLTGVWLHPSARGQGLFVASLPEMEAAFGHFAICSPYSESFKSLMRNNPEVASHAVENLVVGTG